MTAYNRKPEHAIAKCTVDGCAWIRIYFRNDNPGLSPATRAELALASHKLRVHTRRKNSMNGYKAFYRGKSVEVYAESSYKAQLKAAAIFKAKKSFEVTVVLCEKDGQQVKHIATE